MCTMCDARKCVKVRAISYFFVNTRILHESRKSLEVPGHFLRSPESPAWFFCPGTFKSLLPLLFPPPQKVEFVVPQCGFNFQTINSVLCYFPWPLWTLQQPLYSGCTRKMNSAIRLALPYRIIHFYSITSWIPGLARGFKGKGLQ